MHRARCAMVPPLPPSLQCSLHTVPSHLRTKRWSRLTKVNFELDLHFHERHKRNHCCPSPITPRASRTDSLNEGASAACSSPGTHQVGRIRLNDPLLSYVNCRSMMVGRSPLWDDPSPHTGRSFIMTVAWIHRHLIKLERLHRYLVRRDLPDRSRKTFSRRGNTRKCLLCPGHVAGGGN